MATRKTAKADPAPEPFVPPFYEATERLYWYNPEGGAMPLLAHMPGDQVTPEDVRRNNWGHKVKVPAAFPGAAEPPVEQPDAEQEQATGPEGTAPELPDTTQRLDPAAEDTPNAVEASADDKDADPKGIVDAELPFAGGEGS